MSASQERIVQMLFKASQLAEMTGVSQQMVYRMAKDGRLPKPVRIGTRMLRWVRDDIQNIIDDYESKQAPCDASH